MKPLSVSCYSLLGLCVAASLFSCSKEKPVQVSQEPVVIEEKAKPMPEVKEEVLKEIEEVPEVIPEVVELKPSPMELALMGQVLYLSDDDVVRKDIEGKPEFYIIYYTAEWSGNCKARIAEIKQTYEDKIASNPKVELIMVSLDSDSEWMMGWARRENFAWPMIMKDRLSSVPIIKDIGGKAAHHFQMVDKNGERQPAYDLETCLELINQL